MQTFVVSSQTRPEPTPPQSVSMLHPHTSPGRQIGPVPCAVQFVVSVGEHSPQSCVVVSQTWPAGHWFDVTHCTHWLVVGSQWRSGACVHWLSFWHDLMQLPTP